MRVGWIGLGDMGYPMAGHVARKLETLVWNRTSAVAERHAQEHGTRAVDLEDVGRVDVLVTCLPTSTEVAELADRVEDHLAEGTTWIDCTSGDPTVTRQLDRRLRALGVGLVDAPVSGMVDGAVRGSLTVIAGGTPEDLERVRSVLQTFADRIVHVGPTGSGHLVKALNNAAFAGHLLVASELVRALERGGADLEAALAAINASSGRSHVTERFLGASIYTDTPAPGFRIGMLTKDVRLAAGLGRSRLLSELAQLYETVVDAAGWDADAQAAFTALGELTSRGEPS